jgi:DNA invertase Pin-like site-specific DNA recombinase
VASSTRRRTRPDTPRAAVYCRISDARDGDTAGVDRQREDCLRLVEDRGFNLVGTYIDNNRSAFSGRSRPEYERLLADVDAGLVDVIVVWATDRLYRRLSDLETLVERLNGVDVLTCRSGDVQLDSADGKLHARLLGSVAQHSSEKAGERVARAAEARARSGGFNGGKRRFGYTADGSALVEDEAEALRWAYAYLLDGGTMRGVVTEWQARGLTGPSGGAITHPSARDYLLRPMNAGIAVYQGVEIGETGLPRIVDEDTWRAVRAILTDPSRRTSVGRPPRTLLGSLARCAVCGERATGGSRASRVGPPREPIYKCRTGCVSRSRVRLDEVVAEVALAYLERHRDELSKEAADVAAGGAGDLARRAEALRRERLELEAAFERGDLDVAAYAHGMKANTARRAELDASASSGVIAAPAVRQVVEQLDVRAAWDAADMDTRREILREIIAEVRIGPNATPGKFDPSTVEIQWRSQ